MADVEDFAMSEVLSDCTLYEDNETRKPDALGLSNYGISYYKTVSDGFYDIRAPQLRTSVSGQSEPAEQQLSNSFHSEPQAGIETLTGYQNVYGDSRPPLERQQSIVDGLLLEIYDRWHDHRLDSFDSDTFTEYSSTSDCFHGRRQASFLEIAGRPLGYLHRANLQDYGVQQLREVVLEVSRHVNHMSARLVKQLKRRERRMSKLQTNCDIVTAIIQASSPKRRIDTRMRFSVEPQGGDTAFDQWKDAMKAVARLPLGLPDEFRKKVWLSLADQHIQEMKIDWEKTVKFVFNERSNPDDNTLGMQIVKDLHRTGYSGFSGEDNEAERAVLKRILLAYARWNKAVGYCQGFNVIAALLLEVMEKRESDALKVMIYLLDHVLPQGYFANNLRALSVDMAVFRDLINMFPKLSRHLDYLQHAQDTSSGGCYEPPLTNVFTMQWFLTLFATCLPKATVLRIWDSVMLDGSEILLRTALVIWGKLSSRILTVWSADEFYTLMGDISQEMLEGAVLDADAIIKSVYSIAPFPLPQLGELREKYTYNIRPLSGGRGDGSGAVPGSDEDEVDEEELESITCFTGFIPTTTGPSTHKHRGDGDQRASGISDMASLGPGAYGLGALDSGSVPSIPAYMERMSTDIGALKKQYDKLKQRQNQAHVIITSASARQQAARSATIMPTIETPTAMNHLFLNKQHMKGRNRYVAAGPRIANMYPRMIPQRHTTTCPQKSANTHAQDERRHKWSQKLPTKLKTHSNKPVKRAENSVVKHAEGKGCTKGASGSQTLDKAPEKLEQAFVRTGESSPTVSGDNPESSTDSRPHTYDHHNTGQSDNCSQPNTDQSTTDRPGRCTKHDTDQPNTDQPDACHQYNTDQSNTDQSNTDQPGRCSKHDTDQPNTDQPDACHQYNTDQSNTDQSNTDLLNACSVHDTDQPNTDQPVARSQIDTDQPNSDRPNTRNQHDSANLNTTSDLSNSCTNYVNALRHGLCEQTISSDANITCESGIEVSIDHMTKIIHTGHDDSENVSTCDSSPASTLDTDAITTDLMLNKVQECDVTKEPTPQRSPLIHNDSGMGTSITSLFSSSTESSPQHGVLTQEGSSAITNIITEQNSSIADQSVSNIVTTDSIGDQRLNVLCQEISETFRVETQTSGEKVEADTVGVEETDMIVSNCNNNAVICVNGNDRAGPVTDGVGASGTMGEVRDVNKEQQTDGVKCSDSAIDDPDLVDDCLDQTGELRTETDHGASSRGNLLTTSMGVLHKSRSEGEVSTAWRKMSNTGSHSDACMNDQSCRRAERYSSTRSNSNLSTCSNVSDSAAFPEVFVGRPSDGLSSVQQYYMKKQNLSKDPPQENRDRLKQNVPKKLFNPFPVKHLNNNRAKNGIKLGLYKQSTLEQFERNLKSQVVWGK